ncbi:unnamed protein product [Bursaphelenchus xylophilus]|uniref:Snurportin-1 n=1 Tax=Bursaphelenchus xylophilus TaxID=6326 RepID=A0A1I7SX25_BURXY|nr:unnamed protein product [Bursaphelenchus xylophilus]CAG9100128.1 unnamed protein product [Bursaphelenchus xylophilus]
MSQEAPKDDVEGLLEGFATSVEVTPNNTAGDHPRYSMYKNFGKLQENQRHRRNEVLERQKTARLSRLDANRTISDASQPEVEDEDGNGFMEVDRRRRRQKSHGDDNDKKFKPRFQRKDMKGRLMYSEWLIDIPQDLQDAWLALPAPAGKRVLVLSENAFTYIYDKRGAQLSRFKSSLNNHQQTNLIDGILCKNTIYVLDYLIANDIPLEDCEYDCRRTMGSSFLREAGCFDQNDGQFNFAELPAVPARKDELKLLMEREYDFTLDGVLFYYSKVHYYNGQTPLVVWLKPWMLPEILGVPINQNYQKESHQTPQEFISDFHKKHPTYGLPITKKEHRKSESHDEPKPN